MAISTYNYMFKKHKRVHFADDLVAHLEFQDYSAAENVSHDPPFNVCKAMKLKNRNVTGNVDFGGRNIQCGFLIRGWHQWDCLVNPSDDMCAAMWSKAKEHMDFVGNTYDMQSSFAELSRLTGVSIGNVTHVNSIGAGIDLESQDSRVLASNDLNAEQVERINATQQGDWAMFADVPFGPQRL